jgi:hypothetical protein
MPSGNDSELSKLSSFFAFAFADSDMMKPHFRYFYFTELSVKAVSNLPGT